MDSQIGCLQCIRHHFIFISNYLKPFPYIHVYTNNESTANWLKYEIALHHVDYYDEIRTLKIANSNKYLFREWMHWIQIPFEMIFELVTHKHTCVFRLNESEAENIFQLENDGVLFAYEMHSYAMHNIRKFYGWTLVVENVMHFESVHVKCLLSR